MQSEEQLPPLSDSEKIQTTDSEKIQNVKKRWICNWCPENHPGFSSKQAFEKHQTKGVCLKKGYLCMRCLSLWDTPHELYRHQTALRKCKKMVSAIIERDDNDNVAVISRNLKK